MSPKPKAQVFSFDFMLATSIFLVVFIVVYMYWTYTAAQIQETQYFNDMVDKAFLISEAWFREGVPSGWNSSNYIELGLQSDHKLNETKMRYLNDIEYKKVKDSIGVQPYEFFYRVYAPDRIVLKPPVAYINGMPITQLDILKQLNDSGLIWDFYEGDPNVDYITGYRDHFVGTPEDHIVEIISKIDGYNSIVLEHSHLRQSDLDANNQTILKDWVNTTEHTLFNIGQHANFLNIFGLTPDGVAEDEGEVSSLDPILINVDIGDEITFHQGHEPFDNTAPPYQMRTIVVNKNDASECLFCRWWYDNGTIYYAVDTSQTCCPPSIPKPIVGLQPFGYNFKFGEYPTDPDYVLKIERFSILNSSLAKIEVILWV